MSVQWRITLQSVCFMNGVSYVLSLWDIAILSWSLLHTRSCWIHSSWFCTILFMFSWVWVQTRKQDMNLHTQVCEESSMWRIKYEAACTFHQNEWWIFCWRESWLRFKFLVESLYKWCIVQLSETMIPVGINTSDDSESAKERIYYIWRGRILWLYCARCNVVDQVAKNAKNLVLTISHHILQQLICEKKVNTWCLGNV